VSSSTLTPSDLAHRQAAVAAALRAIRDEPAPPPPPAVATAADLALLQDQVRRLTERLDRVADEVELLREPDDAPLAWPADVEASTRVEVPPLEVSRGNSPAFDILLGAGRLETA